MILLTDLYFPQVLEIQIGFPILAIINLVTFSTSSSNSSLSHYGSGMTEAAYSAGDITLYSVNTSFYFCLYALNKLSSFYC